MTSPQSRTPSGIPAGGQFAVSSRAESTIALPADDTSPVNGWDKAECMEFLNRNRLHPAIFDSIVSGEYPVSVLRDLARRVKEHPDPQYTTLDEQTTRAAEIQAALAAQDALAHRLDAYKFVLRHCEDGQSVSTLTWPEEPNEDGTFDVAFNVVYDANGVGVEDVGDASISAPAGWFTGNERNPYRTAYDVWREDSENPDSDIDIRKVREWHQAYTATASEPNETPEETAKRERRSRRSRHDAAIMTRFEDLRPGDRFMVDRYDDVVEVEVTGSSVDAEDMFGRPMKNLPCKRLDTGAEGPYMYGPDGTTRKVERPAGTHAKDPKPEPSPSD